jgi:signal transduction histidine kinase
VSADVFDAAEGLKRLGDLVRLTAPPAGRAEICDQGLALTAAAVEAGSALLFLAPAPGGEPEIASTWGTADADLLAAAGRAALTAREPISAGRDGDVVSVLLPGGTAPAGALVLGRPALWDAAAREFVRSSARVIGAALRAWRAIVDSREQRELLAQRNLELDVLRDLALRLHEFDDDESILQAALELILDKLGLEAGWIFWGERSRGMLELAAAHGIDDRFREAARRTGIGGCLCNDVFESGRLQFARNTTDCPRLPDLTRNQNLLTHACIPLKFERGVLGVMNIGNRPEQLFSPRELQFLEAAGKQICLAVDKARTERAERRRNAEAQALAALARAIGGTLRVEEILAVVGGYARDLLGVERCALLLGGPDGDFRLAHLAGPAFPEAGRGGGLASLGFSAAVPVLRDGLAFSMEAATSDPRIDADAAVRNGIVSALLVPLGAHGVLRGVLLASRGAPGPWSLEHVELADALGRQTALAIDNARLYGDAQRTLTELRRAQEGMMRIERLAAIGTLAASLAHEVRNPLNSINLQLVLLGRRLARLPEPERGEMVGFVETAHREINRLDGLVQESLSLSSVDRLSLVPRSPENAVRDVLALMAPLARERGVDVRADLAGIETTVPLDSEKFKQVLINLVRNAIEAMPGGGALDVSSRHEDGAIVIRISDTGIGIEPGVDVFDLFVTTKDDGTGLGLPIAKRIVEAHGGTLSFESLPGVGTTFTVALKVL